MIKSVFAGLVSAGIRATVEALYRNGYIRSALDSFLYFIGKTGRREEMLLPRGVSALQRTLVRFLLRDQSRFGWHRGQFGRAFDPAGAAMWQNVKSKEQLDLKPRMYLTYWPTLILHSHGLAHRAVGLACSGVKSLFDQDRIPLFTSAPRAVPTCRPTERDWNLRHTMEAAHLLAQVEPSSRVARKVIDLMLDSRNQWQDSGGGWWHTSERHDRPDLWSTVYAVKLLGAVDSIYPAISGKERDIAANAIKNSVRYLEAEWEATAWEITGKVGVEENLVLMYVELSTFLRCYSRRLHDECVERMQSWLTASGSLSRSYLDVLARQKMAVPAEQAYARMAYALYLSNAQSQEWVELFRRAIEGVGINKLLSSELAFLLDLSFAYNVDEHALESDR